MSIQKVEEMQTIGLVDQLSRSLLLKKLKLIHSGQIHFVETTAGVEQTFRFGQDDAPEGLRARVRILNSRAYGRIVFGGTIGVGESYMDGDWDSDDLTQVIRVFARNHELHTGLDSGIGALLTPFQKIFHFLRKNSIKGARENIHAHYDIGNDFFELFLDSSYMYSAAIFEHEKATLEEAQFTKLDRICKKLDLKPSDHVMEIGTGWGSFAIHAAKHYGCKVTTTTISEEQFKLAKERVAEAGVSDRVELLFQDYRLLTGKYDKLVSIEMIEAVGLDNLDAYFKKCSSLLKDDGQMLLQAITIRDQQYESAKKGVDFIQRYIFPGSGIPSIAAMSDSITEHTDFQIAQLEDFGAHYARTLKEWDNRLVANHQKLLQRGYPEVLYRMWRYYFGYCEGGFEERNIGVSQILLTKPKARRQPLIGKL
jgi:cyclopropane-fatty-acyl-phospholipid synthase